MSSGTALPWLVLFDIDGTLLKCGPQIHDIFASSLVDTFGTAGPISSYSFAGRTDYGIVRDLMSAAGLAEQAIRERLGAFEDLYVERLEARLDGDRMSVLPGVLALLERMAAREDVALGLLTGNFERGAWIKLSRVGLDRYFPFGAFGDGVAERSELPPVALSRARGLLGARPDVSRVLIVGDSVLDVVCARDNGIRCVAVATGFATRRELGEAGADCVVRDLSEVEGCHEVFAPMAVRGE